MLAPTHVPESSRKEKHNNDTEKKQKEKEKTAYDDKEQISRGVYKMVPIRVPVLRCS
jgi:hypothetical protein